MVSERVPLTILNNLIHDEEYTRKVIPFIEEDYFEEKSDKVVFEEIHAFLKTYDSLPTKEVLQIEVGKRTDLTQDEFQSTEQLISALSELSSLKFYHLSFLKWYLLSNVNKINESQMAFYFNFCVFAKTAMERFVEQQN